MAKNWKESGYDVTVLTCFPNHPDGIIKKGYENRSFLIENLEGIKVCRVFTFATPNSGFLKKIISHLVFMVNAVRQGSWVAKRAQILLVSSPTFFSVISAYVLSRIYKKPYIFEVRDLWPAIFKDLGVLKNRYILYALESLEIFLYKKSSKIVTVTKSFEKDIAERGINPKKIKTIYNGVDLSQFSPIEKNISFLNKLGLEQKFIVLYIGAHGISQGLETLINVANKIRENKTIHFLFVGDGAQKNELKRQANMLKLQNITFVKSQPKNMVKTYYSIADVVCVPLRNINLFDSFIPSKIFEIMAMEKPIIASLRGEAAKILSDSKASLVCDPEDEKKILDNILLLYNNHNRLEELGKQGRKYVTKNFDRSILSRRYEKIFNSII